LFNSKDTKNGATAQWHKGTTAQLELFPFYIVIYVITVIYRKKSVISLKTNFKQKN